MLKIMVAIDSLRPSLTAISYALDLTMSQEAELVAVFLDDVSNYSYEAYQTFYGQITISQEKHRSSNEIDDKKREKAVAIFEDMIRGKKVNYRIHHDKNISLTELKEESMYADLLVIESKETMAYYAEKIPTHFIKNLLKEIHCPVLTVPAEYKKINRVLFLYDGGPHSTHAIKMFNYLFPLFKGADMEVLTVQSKKRELRVLNNHLLKEYLKEPFPHAVYTVLKGLPDIEIINYLKGKHENEIIVLGAYDRGKLSRMLRPSIIEALMKEIKAPLFINHN